MLGVSNDTDDVPIPVMNTAQDGSHWTFAINTNAGPVTNKMLEAVSLQVVRLKHDFVCLLLVDADGLSQTHSSSSTLSSLSTSASTAISSSPAETTPATTSITAGSVPSSSVSNGAIAGIVVAVVTAALVALGLLFFMWWRRRQQRHNLLAGQAALTQQHKSQISTTIQELDSRPSPLLAHMVSDDRERIQSRATEMP